MKKRIVFISSALIVALCCLICVNSVSASNQMHYNENQIFYKGVANFESVEISVNNEISILTDGFNSSLYGLYDTNVSKVPQGVYYYVNPENTQDESNSLHYSTLVSNYSSNVVSNSDGSSATLFNPSYDVRVMEYSLDRAHNYVVEDVVYKFNYNDVIISNNYRDLTNQLFGRDTIFAFYVLIRDSDGNIVNTGNIFNVERSLTVDLYDVNNSKQSITYDLIAESTKLQDINVFYFRLNEIPEMEHYYFINPTLTIHYIGPLNDGDTVDIEFLDVITAQSVSNDKIIDENPSLLSYKSFDNSLDYLKFYNQLNSNYLPEVDIDIDFTSWITNAVTSFLDTDILGVFSISDILMFILALGLTIMMIKFFMGG